MAQEGRVRIATPKEIWPKCRALLEEAGASGLTVRDLEELTNFPYSSIGPLMSVKKAEGAAVVIKRDPSVGNRQTWALPKYHLLQPMNGSPKEEKEEEPRYTLKEWRQKEQEFYKLKEELGL